MPEPPLAPGPWPRPGPAPAPQPGLVYHETPGIAATPRSRTPPRWVAAAGIALATIASMGLAGLARPLSTHPEVDAADYLAGSGQRTFLKGEQGPVVIETAHLPGMMALSEAPTALWMSILDIGFEQARGIHWVSETELTSAAQTPSYYALGADGLLFYAGGSGTGAISASPAVIELPPNPSPGTTWEQETTLTATSSGVKIPVKRKASIAASPRGTGCIDVHYADTFNDETNEVTVSRCPGVGIVATSSATLSSDPPAWPGDPVTITSTPIPLDSLTPLQPELKNGSADLTPHVMTSPVPLGNGFAVVNSLNQQLVAFAPGIEGQESPAALNLTWTRRPGPSTLGLLGVGDLVVAATSDRHLVAYDSAGLVRWQVDTTDVAGLPPVQVDETTMAVLTLDGWLSAHDLRTGEQVWRTAAPAGEVPLGVIRVDDRPMVVLAANKDLVIYDRDQEFLSVTMLARISSVTQTPSGLVVADEGGLVTLIDLQGRARWSTWTVGCEFVTSIGDTVFCPQEEDLLAFSAATGRTLFTRPLVAERVITDGSSFAVLTPAGVNVMTPQGETRTTLPMPTRTGTDTWMVRGNQELLVISSMTELTRWGRP